MSFLLDVNALLALVYLDHSLHRRVGAWIDQIKSAGMGRPRLMTCAITELGLVRILPQLSGFDGGVLGAQRLLAELKASTEVEFIFLADDQGVDRLPPWVKTHQQTTDGHLAELACAQGVQLATLDEGIPDALLIPR